MLGAGYNSSSSLVGFERRDMDLENILFWETTSESCSFCNSLSFGFLGAVSHLPCGIRFYRIRYYVDKKR